MSTALDGITHFRTIERASKSAHRNGLTPTPCKQAEAHLGSIICKASQRSVVQRHGKDCEGADRVAAQSAQVSTHSSSGLAQPPWPPCRRRQGAGQAGSGEQGRDEGERGRAGKREGRRIWFEAPLLSAVPAVNITIFMPVACDA